MKLYKITFLLFLCMSLISLQTAQAQEARLIGTYGDWSAYVFTEAGNKVCFMASQPVKDVGDYTQRGDIFALITHRPGEGTRNVFSYIAGYTYQDGSDVNISVNGKNFVLFTQDDTAWTPDATSDNNLSEAIRKGSNLTVKGTSSRGTRTTDTYSLKGSGKAHEVISKECGI